MRGEAKKIGGDATAWRYYPIRHFNFRRGRERLAYRAAADADAILLFRRARTREARPRASLIAKIGAIIS